MTDEERPARGGRPRHYDPETEQAMLLDAGLKVIRRRGYDGVTVAAVLAEAGVSTRAFYRHFRTKGDLFIGVFMREAVISGVRFTTAVDAAADPPAALDAWLDAYLDLFYDPRRVARVSVLQAPDARRAPGFDDAMRRAVDLLAAPLKATLAAGQRAGVLDSPRPEVDAQTILGVASSVANPAVHPRLPDRASAAAQVRRFCWPAIGLRV